MFRTMFAATATGIEEGQGGHGWQQGVVIHDNAAADRNW